MPTHTNHVCSVLTTLFGAAILATSSMAQTTIVPLDTLVATKGSITAGPITFSDFQKPNVLVDATIGIALGEFNDIGVSAVVNPDSTVSLNYVGINPATGLASPLVTGPTAAGEFVRLARYTATVNNAAVRMHSVSQSFGPAAVITGSSAGFNKLYGYEPKILAFGSQQFDIIRDDFFQGFIYDPWQILFHGGNLPAYTLINEFGIYKGHLGADPGASIDSYITTFTMVSTGSPVPPVVVNLAMPGDGAFGGLLTKGLYIEPASYAGQILLTDYAQDGGAIVTLTSSNPAALPVPATITVPQGNFLSPIFAAGPANVDFPTTVNVSATFNGRTLVFPVTVNPATPLAISNLLSGSTICPVGPCLLNATMGLNITLNRQNVSPETIQLVSSRPDICPIPASVTLPAFATAGTPGLLSFILACKPVAEHFPIHK